MFKRAMWTGVGFGLGMGSSWWVRRKVKATVASHKERLAPAAVRRRVGRAVSTRVKAARSDVTEALREGKATASAYRSDADEILRPHLRAVPD